MPGRHKQDYIGGKHKANCAALGKLWQEKANLEGRLWEKKSKISSTNPFDDDDDNDDEVYCNYPIVGTFWHDRPTGWRARERKHFW